MRGGHLGGQLLALIGPRLGKSKYRIFWILLALKLSISVNGCIVEIDQPSLAAHLNY
jgi:hypothetical protein